MQKKTTLIVILIISIVGILFSGYLSLSEIVSGSCTFGCSGILGVPTCVYGLAMYIAIVILSILGLSNRKN